MATQPSTAAHLIHPICPRLSKDGGHSVAKRHLLNALTSCERSHWDCSHPAIGERREPPNTYVLNAKIKTLCSPRLRWNQQGQRPSTYVKNVKTPETPPAGRSKLLRTKRKVRRVRFSHPMAHTNTAANLSTGKRLRSPLRTPNRPAQRNRKDN